MNTLKGSDELLTAGELAKFLRVTKQTVLNWAREFGCPHITLPGCFRFRLSDVQAWLEKLEDTNE